MDSARDGEKVLDDVVQAEVGLLRERSWGGNWRDRGAGFGMFKARTPPGAAVKPGTTAVATSRGRHFR